MTIDVQQHYCDTGRLTDDIRATLVAMGKDMDRLEPADLEAIDEFHIRGRAATMDLALRLDIKPGSQVLDVGSGLGGPARTIAHAFDCRVAGIDATRDFCDAAGEMSRWVGLEDAVSFTHGDAIAMDFRPLCFDAAFSIHAAMNISPKDKLYACIRRSLKADRRFGIYDVIQGEGGAVRYPVPWARNATISHLSTGPQMCAFLRDAGFRIVDEIDSTDASAEWFAERLRHLQAFGPPRLGFKLFLGNSYAEMVENQVRNLSERRIRTVSYVTVATA